jgi:hypothetical protein
MASTGIVKAVSDALAPMFRPAGNLIDGVEPGSWASPQNPIRPTLQLGVGIRQWDFTPGINLQFTPRGDVAIKFPQLWNVSNSFDLCRLMIETRKDQVVNRPWLIRVKAQPGETKKAQADRQKTNPNVAKVTNLLKCPDGVHSFDIWIRMWLEQLLVFDAPCIYPVRSMGDTVLSLRLVSGATITPLLDQFGFVPQPPDPAYQQIILGIPTANVAASAAEKKYTVDQLVYSPRNPRVDSRWGFSPVEQIITTLSIGANRQQFLRDYYVSGNVPEGLLPMPESWTAQQIKDFQKWFDAMLAGNLRMKRRMIMVPDAKRPPTMTKHEALTDVTDDYLIRVVAYAFSISPQNLIKQVNRGTAKESSDTAQIEGLEPYLKHVENVMNGQIIERQLKLDDVEFAFQDEREMDPLKQAQTDQIYLTTGTYTRNEIREARGDDPRPEPAANELNVVTPGGVVSIDQAPADPADEEDDVDEPPKPGRSTPVKVKKIASLKVRAGDLTPKSRQARNDFSKQLIKFLASQRDRVSTKARQEYSALKAAHITLSKGDTEEDTKRAAAILALLDWDYYTLYGISVPYLQIAAEEGAHAGAYQTAANLGASLPGTLAEAMPKVKAAADARAAEMVGMEITEDGTLADDPSAAWSIATTAKDNVLATIRQGIAEGWTPEQLEAVMQASVVWTPDHGELIADNEISRQQASGHVTSWLASGEVLEYQWTVMDLGCCALCASFSMLGPVKVGYEFAPMIFAPGAHPSCRCWLTVTKIAGG